MTAEPCCFPTCREPANQRDDGTHACTTHERVHVATSGSWGEGDTETHRHLPKGKS